ncbi:MAG: hypothetical protein MZV63_07335 [Marinilabiliales bacterium]|nr:hypothetical protein [Marinilabiliales bacterium]
MASAPGGFAWGDRVVVCPRNLDSQLGSYLVQVLVGHDGNHELVHPSRFKRLSFLVGMVCHKPRGAIWIHTAMGTSQPTATQDFLFPRRRAADRSRRITARCWSRRRRA